MVIAMIAILFSVMVGIINPFAQIQKSNDAQTKQNLEQLRSALDTYYNDHSCYPTSVPFGSAFTSGSTVYMEHVAQATDCNTSTGANCYVYQTDGSNCPSWFVLYAHIASYSAGFGSVDFSCPLEQMSKCLPSNYAALGYNFCLDEGNVNCSYIYQNSLPTPVISQSPTTPTLTSGPTQAPVNCYPNYYDNTGVGGTCETLSLTQAHKDCNIFGGPYVCYQNPSSSGPCNLPVCNQ